jgi:hypothetical protein
MKKSIFFLAFVLIATSFGFINKKPKWVSLFDGKSLEGWKVGDNASAFKVENGAIVVNGPVGHLFYDGSVGNHNFKNFEFKAQVMTTKGSNSGIYFHTIYQEKGWPSKGYEVQVNNSHTDWKRTASLYNVQDVKEVFVADDVWYTEQIIVQGNRIITKVNDKVVVDYAETPERANGNSERKLSSGTFALQAHDPKSKVFYKDIMVKILPD